jgi:hypothetical protein
MKYTYLNLCVLHTHRIGLKHLPGIVWILNVLQRFTLKLGCQPVVLLGNGRAFGRWEVVWKLSYWGHVLEEDIRTLVSFLSFCHLEVMR